MFQIWRFGLPFNLTVVLISYLAVLQTICESSDKTRCIRTQDDVEAFFRKKVSKKSNYWKWIEPSGVATNFTVSMQMRRMTIYDDIHSTFDIQMNFDFEWDDPRLQLGDGDCASEDFTNFTLDGNEWHYSQIWVPKLRVSKNKDPNVLNSLRDSQITFFQINNLGKIRVQMRANLNLNCPMDYRKYPFDSQSCKISLISNYLSKEKLILKWRDFDQFKINSNLHISSHSLVHFTLGEQDATQNSKPFGKLTVELFMKRQWEHYALVVFLPSMLIVATSWLSFWIEITSPPARITLSVTTMLAMVTVSKEMRQDLPKVPYIKAIDLWFAGCTVSIFLSLMEYALVAYTFRAEKLKYKERKRFKRSFSSVSLSSLETHTAFSKMDSSSHLTPMESDRFGRRFSANCLPRNALPSPQHRIQFTFSPPESPKNVTCPSEIELSQLFKDTPQEVAESIDRKCRIIFPSFFALFNLIYWSFLN